ALWARFDPRSMVAGIGVLAAAVAFLLVFARGVGGDFTDLAPVLAVRGGAGLAAGGGRRGIRGAFVRARGRVAPPVPRSAGAGLAVALVLGLAAGFASNSYTV